jgi:hypothetical protein
VFTGGPMFTDDDHSENVSNFGWLPDRLSS